MPKGRESRLFRRSTKLLPHERNRLCWRCDWTAAERLMDVPGAGWLLRCRAVALRARTGIARHPAAEQRAAAGQFGRTMTSGTLARVSSLLMAPPGTRYVATGTDSMGLWPREACAWVESLSPLSVWGNPSEPDTNLSIASSFFYSCTTAEARRRSKMAGALLLRPPRQSPFSIPTDPGNGTC